MATSPLFGWEEPDDVDLVKDGAAAIRTLGNAIDTSMGDLLGGTSGQVLSKNSNTNMDFTWVTPDDANAIQNAIVDAKGDLIAATAADTPARLAVGTNGQVLTADSTAATGLKWATAGGGDDGPTFGVRRSGTQTVTANTWTTIQFNVEDFDTNSNYNTSTYKFTPTVAGYYQVNLAIGGSGTENRAMLNKNGSFTAAGQNVGQSMTSQVAVILYMNGSSDYLEAQAISNSTSIYSDIYTTYFSGSLIRKA
jgi:hypothetical protein